MRVPGGADGRSTPEPYRGAQNYGTNRRVNRETGREELPVIDGSTTDAERAKRGVAPLAELWRQFPSRGRGRRRREMARARGVRDTYVARLAVQAVSRRAPLGLHDLVAQ